MEPMHYKILKILNQQHQQPIHYSKFKEYFPDIPDRTLRQIITENLGRNVSHSPHPDGNGDFLLVISDEGMAAYYEKKYSDFINRRTLWINRIISFIIGVLTTLATSLITWLII
ncbi:MAG: hypothetical protein NC548_39730 [Lachnospiraceae bacterium]|nr:hypothetical protein [Lachnospiraceae bacterium]